MDNIASVTSEISDTSLKEDSVKSTNRSGRFDSPIDVKEYPNHDMIIDEALPIVHEGEVMTEEDMDTMVDGYDAYEQKENEFTKEMYTTKIAFVAFRNAVLHLVQNQQQPKINKNTTSNSEIRDNKEDIMSGSTNQRMKDLEKAAKFIVETKAEACFDAVQVANMFSARRKSKMSRNRSSLFQELLKRPPSGNNEDIKKSVDIAKSSGYMVPESFPAESSPSVSPVSKNEEESRDHMDSVEETKEKSKPKGLELMSAAASINRSGKVASNTQRNRKPDTNFRPRTFVRCKTMTKHHKCIKSALPKFSYKSDCEGCDEPMPASYRTTLWIGGMVKWRTQMIKYQVKTFTKCSCPDCLRGLEGLKQKY
uniref:Uncharacterized protein n=1 Tax=Chaetoceros debilis TaxID=122233 RepID=A0A7S3V750_9STRA